VYICSDVDALNERFRPYLKGPNRSRAPFSHAPSVRAKGRIGRPPFVLRIPWECAGFRPGNAFHVELTKVPLGVTPEARPGMSRPTEDADWLRFWHAQQTKEKS
jgi:hypothetical protein